MGNSDSEMSGQPSGQDFASEAAGYITGASFDINGGDLMM
jgi:hypothetical protein